MAAKRVMLFGASGQVGQALLSQKLPQDWELFPVTRADADITDHRATQNVIGSFKPDLVINSAAMTAVDACETEKIAAMKVNFDAAASIAAQCSAVDAPIIHLSTDFVFDGKATTPYQVDDVMDPPNVYGETKMMGEEAVRHEHSWHVILRISSVFSSFGQNLLTRMLHNIDTRDEIKAVTDQTSCPTYAPDIAAALITITNAILTGKADGFGTFHLTGSPAATRLEFTEAIMEAYAPHTEKRPIIRPALTADFPGFAPRPTYSVLDCSKIERVYGITQKPWRESLMDAMQRVMQSRSKVA
ncbi:MAG: dTDP-4-dehydrorhamnose reductase [Alphaproteobacteria bacterium]